MILTISNPRYLKMFGMHSSLTNCSIVHVYVVLETKKKLTIIRNQLSTLTNFRIVVLDFLNIIPTYLYVKI